MNFYDHFKSKMNVVPAIEDIAIQELDNNLENRNLKGYREKRHFVVRSECFQDLIDEIINNDECSYVIHCGEQVKRDKISPQTLQVILKESRTDRSIREVVSSRLMNYFGVSTTYDTLVKNGDNLSVLSVDFVQKESEVMLLHDLGFVLENNLMVDDANLRRTMDRLYNRNKHIDHRKIVAKSEFDAQKEKIVEEYLTSFVLRRFVLKDGDFYSNNCAALVSYDMSIGSLLNFDFDDALYEKFFDSKEYKLEQMKYIAANYPVVFKKVIAKLDSLLNIDSDTKNLKLVDLVDSAVPNGIEGKDQMAELLYKNVVDTQKLCNDAVRSLYLTRANFETLCR